MQPRLRLTGQKHFSSIHQGGRSWANPLLVLKVLPNGLDRSRFGVVAGKRVGNAVIRNRVKRRLRVSVGSSSVKPGWDVILIARKEAATAHFHQLQQALGNLLSRARLLKAVGLEDMAQ